MLIRYVHLIGVIYLINGFFKFNKKVVKFISMAFLFILTGCVFKSFESNREINECLHFSNMMSPLLEPAATHALQETCFSSSVKNK